MVFQVSIGYQEAPRKWAPNESIPVAGPAIPQDITQAPNRVPLTQSLSSVANSFFCATARCATARAARATVNHGVLEGRHAQPANLNEPRIQTGSDASIYVTIAKGFGTMPPLNENMNVRERWDTVNYVKSLGSRTQESGDRSQKTVIRPMTPDF